MPVDGARVGSIWMICTSLRARQSLNSAILGGSFPPFESRVDSTEMGLRSVSDFYGSIR